jgi:DNA replication and repair protein RecF
VREVDRVLRQRNALLRQLGGRLGADAEVTLDVWDAKLADAGEALARARRDLVDQLGPLVSERYASLASAPTPVTLGYHPPWRERGLAASLAGGRAADVARGVSQIGPHRDDLSLDLGGAAARSHASQGEQRSLALALKLAAHRLVTERVGVPPLLLLDDVFSELDPRRRAALIELLPGTQSLLTSADRLPEGSHPDLVYRVDDGQIEPASVGTRW